MTEPAGATEAAFAGWYATDAQGMAVAQLDAGGAWLAVERAIFAPVTRQMAQRPPETYEAPLVRAEETMAWVDRCKAVARGQFLVTEGELGEAVELTDRDTGEVVWAAVS